MRAMIASFLVFLSSLVCASQFYYIASIHRLEGNLYKDISTGMLIKTQFCLDISIGEAVLRIDGPPGPSMGKIWFADDQVCNVIAIYKAS